MILLDFYRHLLLIVFFPAVFRVLTQRSFPVNSCFLSNYIPFSYLSPLFKEGSLFDRSNYRHISVLVILSKILERHVHISFCNFLTENDLRSKSQFGFRKSRSCELAVTDLIDRLLNNMDNRVLNGLLLVDLKKAFDLVNHSILLPKLQIYGCSSSTVQLFTSYLSDRSQCTNFKGTLSDPLPVSIGVPQGAFLALFSFYYS